VTSENKIGILTISDKGAAGERIDQSGKEIKKLVKDLGKIVRYQIVPDDYQQITSWLKKMTDEEGLNLILTTGGTGFSPRDITPEATKAVLEKEIPGLPELMRFKTGQKVLKAYLSRAKAGIRKKCLIINLPGSPRGVKECLESILPLLPHSLEVIQGKVSECAQDKVEGESENSSS
jgi:molybdenum cofactor synthesis domain-containing protein